MRTDSAGSGTTAGHVSNVAGMRTNALTGSPTGSPTGRCRCLPSPPSLKEQALGALGRFNTNAHMAASEMVADFDTIRRALEAL